ncbi:hypothetical protein [Actinokineospora sp. NBRC 105648]|uniref:PPE domain-containing protein n=1 Tax=Actinokineospora sp. NBRC 105648 TaxID=3032206 RepID=UPI0024A00B35|nr:hypothetical protein [Actinokineospora sp. NBRC 105648]GLZ38690.1 hypothetical protein Acsp05_23140 [Actinokineospora sp. NBRC 105648]
MSARMGTDLVLTDPVNWAARSHLELHFSVHADLDPGATAAVAHEWEQLGATMVSSATRFAEAVRGTESGWQGEAATAARASTTTLADWGGETAATATTISVRLGEQGAHAERARASMPEPVEFSWPSVLFGSFGVGGIGGFLLTLQDLQRMNELSRSGHERAVEVMTELETNSRAVDEALPVFALPPDTALPTTANDTTVLGATTALGERLIAAGADALGTNPLGGNAFDNPSGGGEDLTAGDQGALSGDLFDPASGGEWTPPDRSGAPYPPQYTATSTASTFPPVSASTLGGPQSLGPNSFSPGGIVPNGLGPGGAGGFGPAGFGPTGFGGPGPGGPGSGVVGSPGGGSGVAGFGPTGGPAGGAARQSGPGSGARVVAGAPGQPGGAPARGAQPGAGQSGFPGGAGGGGSKGEPDKERKSAPYVRGESIFEDEERVAPAVIGATFTPKSWVRE